VKALYQFALMTLGFGSLSIVIKLVVEAGKETPKWVWVFFMMSTIASGVFAVVMHVDEVKSACTKMRLLEPVCLVLFPPPPLPPIAPAVVDELKTTIKKLEDKINRGQNETAGLKKALDQLAANRPPIVRQPKIDTPTTNSAMGFDKLARTWVEGSGYRTVPGIRFPVCRDLCLADDRCKMIELSWKDPWTSDDDNSCNLYDHTRIASTSSALAAVGMKRFGAVAGWSMTLYTGRFVEGDGYSTTPDSSRASCSAACGNDRSCQMFEFHDNDNTCSLYAHQRIGGTADNAMVGVKQQ
jgi:PAN domain